MDKTDIVLKPCPFCGGEAVYDKYQSCDGYMNEGYTHRVHCKMCSAVIQDFSEQKVKNWWNNRFEQPNDPLTTEEVKQMNCEPVWINNFEDSTSCWAILGTSTKDGIVLHDIYCSDDFNDYGSWELYNVTWNCYKHKPEESN